MWRLCGIQESLVKFVLEFLNFQLSRGALGLVHQQNYQESQEGKPTRLLHPFANGQICVDYRSDEDLNDKNNKEEIKGRVDQ